MSTANDTTVQPSDEQPIPSPTNIDTLYFKYLLWFAICMYGVFYALAVFNQVTGYVPTPEAQNTFATIIWITVALIAREMAIVVRWIARHMWRVFKNDIVGGIKESLTRIETEYIVIEVPVPSTPEPRSVPQVVLEPVPAAPRPAYVKQSNRAGYVYILAAINSPGLFKIGRTYNLNDRLRTFSVKLPFQVKYEHTIKTDDMYQLERELHNKYRAQRQGGEFFTLSDDDIQWIKDTYKEASNPT